MSYYNYHFCESVVKKPDPPKPHVNPVWYNNPFLSDICITYEGTNGLEKFIAHRLILCSASEWFMKASQNFKEAHGQEIRLEGDDPEGLEALFEFAYKNTYTEIADAPDKLALLQKQFQQHLHIFATADKYQAQALADHAYCRIRDLVELYTQTRKTISNEEAMNAPVFFKWMVQQVYEQCERYFPALRNESEMTRKVAEDALLPAHTSLSPTHSSEVPQYNSTTSGYAPAGVMFHYSIPALGLTSITPSPHATEEDGPVHPIDRLQQLLVQGAIKSWSNVKPDLYRTNIAPIAKAIPDFGTDLAVAALKSSHLVHDPGLPRMHLGGYSSLYAMPSTPR
jgi:hypothetical protein